MNATLKKNLEIVFYLLVELGLAYLLVSGLQLPEQVVIVVGAACVYFGKLIVNMLK